MQDIPTSQLLPGLRQASVALNKIMSPLYTKRGTVQSRLLMDWEKIVGKTLAKGSAPTRLVFKEGYRVNGLLYVEIYHSSLATQMMYMEPIILEKIATYFGYKAVANMRLIQKPASISMAKPQKKPFYVPARTQENPKLFAALEPIEDESLRTSLENLSKFLK